MKYKTCIAALLCSVLFGCAPKAIPVTPIAPAVKHAAVTAKATVEASKVLTTTTKAASTQATSLGFQVSVALADFDKQRTDPTIPAAVAEMNFQTMSRMAAKALEVERATQRASEAAVVVESSAVSTHQEVSELIPAAVENDKAKVALQATIDKMAPDAARGKAMRWTFWIVLIIAAIGGCIYLYVRYGTVAGNIFRKLR